jgi:Tfp pilus assembly protein PilF
MSFYRALRALGIIALAAGLSSAAGAQSRGPNVGTASQPNLLNDITVVLSGRVIIDGGAPLPEPAYIERVCNDKVIRDGRTDFKGNFTITVQLSAPQVGESESTAESSGTGSFTERAAHQQVDPATFGAMLMTCDLRASLVGFRSSTVPLPIGVQARGAAPVNVGTIMLDRLHDEQGAATSATSLNAPKNARKAYEKGHAVKTSKLPEAQQHLEKAVQLYPRYAAAWLDLGQVYAQQEQFDKARNAYTQARRADDRLVPAYIGLAWLAVRESKWQEAAELTAIATQMDGLDFPVAFFYNALANYRLGNLEQAEKSARKTEAMGAQRTFPQVSLLLGNILVSKQNYGGAANEFKAYLNVAPTAANAAEVRKRLVKLEELSTSADRLASRSSVGSATAAGVQLPTLANWGEIRSPLGDPNSPAALSRTWAPQDIDQVIPPVASGVLCPASRVVSGLRSSVKELMDDLQQFSATERIEQVELDEAGNPSQPVRASFKYVAEIRQVRTGELSIEEYRDGRSSNQPFLSNLATRGMAAHALMFYPSMIDDLTITCEGLGSVQGRSAWQMRFAQRPDRPARFREYSTPKGRFRTQLKGRAWLTTDTYQVMRMETDLAKPVDEIALRRDHIIIDYSPIEFHQRNVQLWLPQIFDLYLDVLGRRSHRRHSFSDFELFSVDVAEKIRQPEATLEPPVRGTERRP